MIGWTHTASGEYATAVTNGQLDDDLDRMLSTINLRKRIIQFPLCPYCEEPLTSRHEHEEKGGRGRMSIEFLPKTITS